MAGMDAYSTSSAYSDMALSLPLCSSSCISLLQYSSLTSYSQLYYESDCIGDAYRSVVSLHILGANCYPLSATENYRIV